MPSFLFPLLLLSQHIQTHTYTHTHTQTEGQTRLVPALQQILRERVYEEGSPSVYQTIHKLLTIVGKYTHTHTHSHNTTHG